MMIIIIMITMMMMACLSEQFTFSRQFSANLWAKMIVPRNRSQIEGEQHAQSSCGSSTADRNALIWFEQWQRAAKKFDIIHTIQVLFAAMAHTPDNREIPTDKHTAATLVG